MNDSDIGYDLEWQSVDMLNDQLTTKSETVIVNVDESFPEIKKIFSENFILSVFLNENNNLQ